MTSEEQDELPVEQWLAIRKKAAKHIDAETAEVHWTYAQTLDPYGVDPNLPEEAWQVGRTYFARAPGTDIWVWFADLPAAVEDKLWEKHRAKLAFPAGLPKFLFSAAYAEGAMFSQALQDAVRAWLAEQVDDSGSGSIAR